VPVDAAPVANEEGSLVKVDDGAAHAVAETEAGVVLAAEDLLTDPVLSLSQGDGFAAESAAVEHQSVCRLVEIVHV
jgi:hypothetical protein